MKKLILHIGIPKTGSTSIQAFLNLKTTKQNLEKYGIIPQNQFGGAGMSAAHSLPWIISDIPLYHRDSTFQLTNWAERFNLQNYKTWKQWHKKARAHVSKELNNTPGDTVILSSEAVCGKFAEKPEEVKKFFSEFFDKIEIILFLRRPDLRSVSIWQQRLKLPPTKAQLMDLEPWVKKITTNTWLSGRLAVESWSNCFGKENTHVGIFADSCIDRENALGPVPAFMKFIDPESKFKFPLKNIKTNSSFDYRAVVFIQHMDAIIRKNPQFADIRGKLQAYLNHTPYQRKTTISKSLAQEINAKFEEDNEYIRHNFFPEQSSLYHDDYSMYPETVDNDCSSEDLVQIAMKVFKDLSSGIRYFKPGGGYW